MKEQPDPAADEGLRAKTLDNNLTWLESFGCEITREAEIIRVRHPELPEYNASLILGSSRETLGKVQALAEESALSHAFIFVDQSFLTDAMDAVLSGNGLKQLLVSKIKATRLCAPSRSTTLSLKLARAADLRQWSEVYSEGFERSGSAAQSDNSRWKKSFAHPKVLHWFFVSEGEHAGVCQTCIDNDVVGVYSLTLLRNHRRLSTVIRSARALQNEIFRRGQTIVYFERTRNLRPHLLPRPLQINNLKIVREFISYGTGEVN